MNLRSGHPFWLIKNGILNTYPPLKRDLICQVAILGCGISGAMLAHELTKAGVDCIALDKRDLGQGSTCASTGLLLYELDKHLADLAERMGREKAERVYLASLGALNDLEVLVDEAGGPQICGYSRKQSLYVASTPGEVDDLRAEYEARKNLGIDVHWLDEQEIAADYSFTFPAGILSARAADCDAFRLTHALIAQAKSNGLRIFDRTGVRDIEQHPAAVTLITEQGFSIKADRLVFAAGYESQDYLKTKVARNVSTYAFASEPLESFEGWKNHVHLWETARPYFYARTTSDGRAIVGGEDEPFNNPVRRDRKLPRKVKKLHQRFRSLFPKIESEIGYCWAATFSETDDALPRIGISPEWPRAYFALGYGGNGITFSVLAAKIITDLILDRPNPDADLFRFEDKSAEPKVKKN